MKDKATKGDELRPNRPVRKQSRAIYERIAVDIARRIVQGDFTEGRRLSGRTLMSGEYGVSPETIRRSFALLEEMDVVKVVQNSGVVVRSVAQAEAFIETHEQHDETKKLLYRMHQIIQENEALNRELYSIAQQVFSINTRFAQANPFPIFAYTLEEGSKAIGESLGDLRFWQATEATVVAIRRGGTILLSPGPKEPLKGGDTLLMVGPQDSVDRIEALLS